MPDKVARNRQHRLSQQQIGAYFDACFPIVIKHDQQTFCSMDSDAAGGGMAEGELDDAEQHEAGRNEQVAA